MPLMPCWNNFMLACLAAFQSTTTIGSELVNTLANFSYIFPPVSSRSIGSPSSSNMLSRAFLTLSGCFSNDFCSSKRTSFSGNSTNKSSPGCLTSLKSIDFTASRMASSSRRDSLRSRTFSAISSAENASKLLEWCEERSCCFTALIRLSKSKSSRLKMASSSAFLASLYFLTSSSLEGFLLSHSSKKAFLEATASSAKSIARLKFPRASRK